MIRQGRKVVGLISAAVAATAFMSACGASPEEVAGTGQIESDLTGDITVSGSSTVEPISVLVAEKFQGLNPNLGISVDGPGTGDGFERFCNGETDVSDASRPIDLDEEGATCAANGIEFIELKVAIDGMAVLTHPSNDDVSCLSFADIYALVGPESQGFETWSDADALGAEVGAEGVPYPDVPLDVVGPGEESGTYDSFVEIAIEGLAEERVGEDNIATRPDYQSSPNDNVIIEGITGSSSSLGWVGYSFFIESQDSVKALEVDDGESGCVAPTEESIKSAEYPLARFLYIYVNEAKADENEALASFIDYYLSDAGLASVAEVGYVDLASQDIAASRQAWESRTTGSREG